MSLTRRDLAKLAASGAVIAATPALGATPDWAQRLHRALREHLPDNHRVTVEEVIAAPQGMTAKMTLTHPNGTRRRTLREPGRDTEQTFTKLQDQAIQTLIA